MASSRHAIIIFNGSCGMCETLASEINSASQGSISVIPLRTDKAEALLRQFYPNGHPFGYFLIEERDGHSKISQGTAAALRLSTYLSISDSLRVLGRYLHFRAVGNRFTRKLVARQARPVSNYPIRQRRELLRTAFVGGIALALGGFSSGLPVAAALGSKGHLTKLPPVRLDKSLLINGKMPNHVSLSPTGEVLEVYNEWRPVNSPDCICLGCPCCPAYSCCECMNTGGGEVACYVCCQTCDGVYECSLSEFNCDPGTCCNPT